MGALSVRELGCRPVSHGNFPRTLTSTPQPVACDPLHVCSTKVLPQERRDLSHTLRLPCYPTAPSSQSALDIPCGKAAAMWAEGGTEEANGH